MICRSAWIWLWSTRRPGLPVSKFFHWLANAEVRHCRHSMPYQGFKMLRTTSLFRVPTRPLILADNAGGERNEGQHEHVGFCRSRPFQSLPSPLFPSLSGYRRPNIRLPIWTISPSSKHSLTDLHHGYRDNCQQRRRPAECRCIGAVNCMYRILLRASKWCKNHHILFQSRGEQHTKHPDKPTNTLLPIPRSLRRHINIAVSVVPRNWPL